jgi:dTDP-4-dehydrorhamnose reductase
MKRVLITGASGLLGSNLVLDAAGDHEVAAIAHRRRVEWPGVRSFQADLAEAGAARELMDLVRPEWVIHCAAATDIDACEAEPAQAFRLNRDMAGQVAEAAHAVGARLAHISTDAVFDGERGGYQEDDLSAPINVYGRSKLEGEEAVRAACPEALIIRTNIYGWNAVEKKSLAEWFLDHLQRGSECRGFADVFVSPLLVNDLGDLLFRMLEAGLRGLYHVAGGDCVSKYEFGVRVAQAFDLDAGRIKRASVKAGGLRAPRGRRLCLAGRKIEADLGVHLPGLRDGLARFKALRDQGRPGDLERLARTGERARQGAER